MAQIVKKAYFWLLNSKIKRYTRYSSLLHRFLNFVLIALLAVFFWQPIANFFVHTQADARSMKLANTWNNVAIGGGGFVTNIYLHPQEANLVYMQTDNGGFYRWNAENESWVPLSDRFTLSEKNYYGGEALALDPNNTDLVYIATGLYTDSPGAIFKSVDRGTSWTKTHLQLPMGSDLDKKWAGNRLAVDPFDSQILLFGSRQNGLWRSSDGGINWSFVFNTTQVPFPEIGILAVAFDPQIPGKVYLSAYGNGIYQSNDAGISWSKIANSPTQGMRLAIATDSNLYVTSAVSPGVSRYKNGTWQNITPKEDDRRVFNALSVNPRNSQEIIVSTGEVGRSTQIYYSGNGGWTWQKKESKLNNTVPWWSEGFFSSFTSSIQFDPQIEGRVWLTDWFGVWRTEKINTKPVTWTNYEQGHEQIVTFDLLSPPVGATLLSSVADVNGFYHQDLNSYPTSRLGTGKPEDEGSKDFFQDTHHIAYCAISPQNLVRVGGNREHFFYRGVISKDGGKTWQEFPNFPANSMPMRVAVSATDPAKFVVTLAEGLPIQTSNGGETWQQVSGLPIGVKGPWNWTQPIAADSVIGDRFYYYTDGVVYRSDDGGLSFNPINTNLPKTDWYSIETVLGVEGEIWLSLNDWGLYRSTDGGKTFSTIAGVKQAYLFSLGKSLEASIVPSLYVYGQILDRGEGIFMSVDRGQTWQKISNEHQGIGSRPNSLEASKQKFGLVFVGTSGRGIYYTVVQSRS